MRQRYRPPRPRRAAYITPQGAEKLKKELEFLWREERPKVTQSVAEAAAQGDRSENASYIYGKKRLREIDSRVRFLTKRLEELKIVDPTTRTDTKIFFRAYIRLEDEDEEEVVYRIVGPDESDAKRGHISLDSPMAKALMGKEEGDTVRVKRPKGVAVFEILEVSYQPIDT